MVCGVQNSNEKELLEVAVKDLCLSNLQSMRVSSPVGGVVKLNTVPKLNLCKIFTISETFLPLEYFTLIQPA